MVVVVVVVVSNSFPLSLQFPPHLLPPRWSHRQHAYINRTLSFAKRFNLEGWSIKLHRNVGSTAHFHGAETPNAN
jgi:hypothetical protein